MHIELNMAEISEALLEYVNGRGLNLAPETRIQYYVFDEDAQPFEVEEVVIKISLCCRKNPLMEENPNEANL